MKKNIFWKVLGILIAYQILISLKGSSNVQKYGLISCAVLGDGQCYSPLLKTLFNIDNREVIVKEKL